MKSKEFNCAGRKIYLPMAETPEELKSLGCSLEEASEMWHYGHTIVEVRQLIRQGKTTPYDKPIHEKTT